MFCSPDNQSEPDLTTVGITETPSNHLSKHRPAKRFRGLSGDSSFKDEFLSFKDDIKKMFINLQVDTMNEIKNQFSSLKKDNDTRLTKIEDTLMQIEKSNQVIDKSVSFMSKQYDEMKIKSEHLERDCKEHWAHIVSLEEKIEEMQRISKINFLELRNLPKTQNETRTDLDRYINNLLKTVNANVSNTCIKDVFRLQGKKDNHPSLLIEFSNNTSKNNVIKAVKTYNQSNNEKLNTASLGAVGSNPVYVAEHLTTNAKKLHFIARKHIKNNLIKYCWTSNGKVLVKKSDLEPTVHIKTEEQLEKLINMKI